MITRENITVLTALFIAYESLVNGNYYAAEFNLKEACALDYASAADVLERIEIRNYGQAEQALASGIRGFLKDAY